VDELGERCSVKNISPAILVYLAERGSDGIDFADEVGLSCY